MKIKIGTDIVSVERIKKVFSDRKKLGRLFTDNEINYIDKHSDPFPVIAGRFAAKEAIFKALSPLNIKFDFSEISIITDKKRGPYISFERSDLKNKLENYKLEISISHESEYATAFCVVYNEN
jgi:holo-[acyl-carrier protein] synthase